MKFLVSSLKKYLNNIPDNLTQLINLHITEIESTSQLSHATKIVVGLVLTCKSHPDSDHLNLTTVDVGEKNGGVLQIVCGAANVKAGQYICCALVGAILPGDFKIKKALVRGVESNGMICSLKELGINEHFLNEEAKNGIFYFDEVIEIGVDALEVLGLSTPIIELSLTPNRGDLLSVYGIARDIAAATNQELIEPSLKNSFVTSQSSLYEIELQSPDVQIYMLKVFEGIEIKASPLWLQIYLTASGIRPINNVVDITNYCLLEYGAPLHAFDLKSFQNKKVTIRKATDETFVTLDSVERKLSVNDLVVTNGKEPCALAGVMGGLDSSITPQTTSLLLEAAIFAKESIIKTVKTHNLRSESSLRFEKGVALTNTKLALEKASELLIKLCGAKLVDEAYNFSNYKVLQHVIELDYSFINKKIGAKIKPDEVLNILDKLGFTYKTTPKTLKINFLESRPDILNDVDIVEEIVRIYGYSKIKPQDFDGKVKSLINNKYYFLSNLRKHFSASGFNEIITYSLVDDAEYDLFENLGEKIQILNPLVSGVSILRQSLLNKMIETINYNQNRRNNDLMLFEIGKVFYKGSEVNKLSLGLSNQFIAKNWISDGVEGSFFMLKAMLFDLFKQLNINDKITFKNEAQMFNEKIVNKYRSSIIYYNDNIIIGKIFDVNPGYAKEVSISTKTTLAEINVDLLFQYKDEIKYKPISKFPTVLRDLALIVDKSIIIEDILKMVSQTTRKYLINLDVFDVYNEYSEDKLSLGIRLELNDNEKTLETSDIDKIISQVVNRLKFSFKIEVRS